MDQIGVIIISAVTSVITSWITICQLRKKLEIKAKADSYKNLMIKLEAFFSKSKFQKPQEVLETLKDQQAQKNKQVLQDQQDFFNEYYKAWLYASPKSLIILKEFIIYINKKPCEKNSEKVWEILTKFVKQARTDCGISNDELDDKYFNYFSCNSENNKS
ncbi:MAG: hypothetical protein ACRCV0_06945 [Brevinema sp.]